MPRGRRYLAVKRRLDYDTVIDHTNVEIDSNLQAMQIDRGVSVTPLSLDLTSRLALDAPGMVLR